MENDVRIAAIGEHWSGSARGVQNFVFLAIGTGIAAGIFVDGKLLHGPDWAAGEVGYMHVPGAPEEPAERGAPGSLERAIGGEGIRQQWRRCCLDAGASPSRDLSATEIFALATAGDAQAANVLNRSAQMLGCAVYNISLVLNEYLFVLGGGVGMSELLRDATQRFLDRYTEPTPPKLIISSLGQDAQADGRGSTRAQCSRIAQRIEYLTAEILRRNADVACLTSRALTQRNPNVSFASALTFRGGMTF